MLDLVTYGQPDPALLGPRPRKPLPAHCEWYREHERTNPYAIQMMGDLYDDGHIYTYRVTPPGEKKVPEILTPGTIITTSWGTGPHVVLEVAGPFFYHDPDSSDVFEHWGIGIQTPGEWAAGRKEASGGINDLVAVGARILHLFENNSDEVFIVGKSDVVRRPAPTTISKPIQLDLFA